MDLMRMATGISNLRLAPPGGWVAEVAERCRAGIAQGDFSIEQVERLSAALYSMEALLEVSEKREAAGEA